MKLKCEKWCVIVFNRRAELAQPLADLGLAMRQAPFREVDQRVVGEQVEHAAARGGDPAVVERLEIFDDDGLPLFVRHGLDRKRHVVPPLHKR